MASVALGDSTVFRALYVEHHPRVHRLAYGILLDTNEARDVAQEVFLRLHRAAHAWEPRARIATWLYRVTLNESLTVRRRVTAFRREWLPFGRSPRADAAITANETLATLLRATARLSARSRAVVTLHLDGELAPSEIAPLLDMNANAVRVTLHRGLDALRSALRDAGIEPGEDDMIDAIREFREAG